MEEEAKKKIQSHRERERDKEGCAQAREIILLNKHQWEADLTRGNEAGVLAGLLYKIEHCQLQQIFFKKSFLGAHEQLWSFDMSGFALAFLSRKEDSGTGTQRK